MKTPITARGASLQITLTSRQSRKKASPFRCAGVPYHAADGYIARPDSARDLRLPICETDGAAPAPGKKLVRRESGSRSSPRAQPPDVALLDARENNFSRKCRQTCFRFAYWPGPTSIFLPANFRPTEFIGPRADEALRD